MTLIYILASFMCGAGAGVLLMALLQINRMDQHE